MKKSMILLLGILLASSLVLAQEQAQTYSGFDRLTDNVEMVFTSGDDKVILALEIREKEVDSAIINIQNQGEDKAIKNLERAKQKLQVIQKKVSLDTSEEIKTSVDEITNKINEKENLPDEFEDYLLEEEKTQLTAELTEKTFEYCTELAKEDFTSMLQEEICNPDTAIPGLEKELEELKDIQIKLFVQLMLEIRSCIDDPGTCNCEANVDAEQKAKCEKMVTLAIRCEYQEDETSCNELESMEPTQGDNFAESFVPEFLINLFKEKEYMVEYDVEPSCGVPEECWDQNDKPECRQYDHLKETNADWDEYGNFIGTGNKCDTKDQELTMQESIPQCFDENYTFLEEKCGKITLVENEDGLINYIIENEINGILGNFTNDSEGVIEDSVEVDKVKEIKDEIDQINNQIVNITYAPGTGPGGDSGVVIDKDGQDVVIDGDNNVIDNVVAGDNGTGDLTPDINIDDGNNNVVNSEMDIVIENNIIEDNIIDEGPSDTGDNDLGGVDEEPGESGMVDED